MSRFTWGDQVPGVATLGDHERPLLRVDTVVDEQVDEQVVLHHEDALDAVVVDVGFVPLRRWIVEIGFGEQGLRTGFEALEGPGQILVTDLADLADRSRVQGLDREHTDHDG